MPKQKQKQKTFQKPHLNLHNGHVAFRLICHHEAGIAVIGPGGTTIQKLIRETGISRVHVEDTFPGTEERIVYIVGPGKLDKTLVFGDRDGRFEVSVAQEALVRVLEIIEAKFTADDRWCVRLLAVKGEEKVKSLGGFAHGADVRVLPVEELPLCADLSDDLIQITGDFLAVRRAVLAVTYCLQGNNPSAMMPMNQSHGSVSYGLPNDLSSFDTDAGDGGQSRVGIGMKKVAFKLLCPTYAAGGLIGWRGSIVKDLEKETGARIQVADPVVGSTERVIYVSAMEKEVQNSPAQDAVVRVFVRSIEAAVEVGRASAFDEEKCVTARLLVSLSQAKMLNVEDNAGVEVHILESQCTRIASEDEKVIQIVGEFTEVQICLHQITWALRQSMFSRKKKNTPLLPHELYGWPPHVHAATTLKDELDNLTFSRDTSSSPTIVPEISGAAVTVHGSSWDEW